MDVRSGDLYMTIVQVDSRNTRLYKCSYRSIQDPNILIYKYLFYTYEFYSDKLYLLDFLTWEQEF